MDIFMLVQVAQDTCAFIGYGMSIDSITGAMEVFELLQCSDGTIQQVPVEPVGECRASPDLGA